jgi:CheY-like chemotaxis protein
VSGPSDSPSQARPLLILAVEDEEMNLLLLRAVLKTASRPRLAGARLVEARSISAARRALDSDAVDLVLLDVRLPDGDGLELARELAARPDRPGVLIMSASVLPAEREKAMAAGADGFLGKPYLPRELLDWIDRLSP